MGRDPEAPSHAILGADYASLGAIPEQPGRVIGPLMDRNSAFTSRAFGGTKG